MKCEECGYNIAEATEFVIEEKWVTINGTKYLKRYFKCPKCDKEYLIEIAVGRFGKAIEKLINWRQDLKDIEYYCLNDKDALNKARIKVAEINNELNAMVLKGQALENMLNY